MDSPHPIRSGQYHTREPWRLPLVESIIRIRKAYGLSQKQMAAEMGIPAASYRRIETGKFEIPVRALERVRAIFGLDPYLDAFLRYADTSKLPPRIQQHFQELRQEWMEELEVMQRIRQRLPGF